MSQEIYVKEMPKIYYDSKTGNESIEAKGHFVVKSLHNHDKELVEKVFKRLREAFLIGCCEGIFHDCHWLGKQAVLDKLDQIQKEFEDGE